eukprot:scaffold643793_cov17-Prasinocladus_malaysianus.AAC.1
MRYYESLARVNGLLPSKSASAQILLTTSICEALLSKGRNRSGALTCPWIAFPFVRLFDTMQVRE